MTAFARRPEALSDVAGLAAMPTDPVYSASKAAIRSDIIWVVNAFSRSGRLRVMIATPSSTP